MCLTMKNLYMYETDHDAAVKILSSSSPREALSNLSQVWDLPIDSPHFTERLDQLDPLREYRKRFVFPEAPASAGDRKECIYFCGNSLGLQPRGTRDAIGVELLKWEKEAVEAHHKDTVYKEGGMGPWMTIDERVNASCARIVGASEKEVAVMGTLSNNIHLLLVSFYKPTSKRFKILIESKAFPSDYVSGYCNIRRLYYYELELPFVKI